MLEGVECCSWKADAPRCCVNDRVVGALYGTTAVRGTSCCRGHLFTSAQENTPFLPVGNGFQLSLSEKKRFG